VNAGQYFDEQPETASKPHPVEVSLPDVALTLTADRGVFSADHLDAGTKLLLLETPPLTATDQRILDVGCGWGPIACVAALRAPNAHIWAVDTNQRARALTRANAESIGATDRITVAAPDEVDPDVRFDRILSNPPIRIGKTALHDLLVFWLDRLTPTGRAHLVVQKHLGSDSLAAWLDRQHYPVERLTSRAGFRILELGARP
jgi:16S rRNA (guanine1207-N2)-methyltransferase